MSAALINGYRVPLDFKAGKGPIVFGVSFSYVIVTNRSESSAEEAASGGQRRLIDVNKRSW